MARFPQGVEPVFIRRRDLPPVNPLAVDSRGSFYSALDICLAAERTAGKETVYGAQDIKGLWRVYPLTRAARNTLLIEGISINGHFVALHDKNPFILKGGDGKEIPATKLFISDIPLSCSDTDIETALARTGCVMRSSMTLERIRDRDGKLTRFVTGRRFVFINVPQTPLERSLKIGSFTAQLYYKEQPRAPKKPVSCSRCLQPGHHVSQCQNLVTCKECRQSGHRSGDPVCSALTMDLPLAASQAEPLKNDRDMDKEGDWEDWGEDRDCALEKGVAGQEESSLLGGDLKFGEEDIWEETVTEMDSPGSFTGHSDYPQVPTAPQPAITPTSDRTTTSRLQEKLAATYSKRPSLRSGSCKGEAVQSGSRLPSYDAGPKG